jgi:hypothetical protein
MNGTDPSPQDVSAERALFTEHKVQAFVFNQQVTDSLTQSFAALAKANGVPIVGVYETMPTRLPRPAVDAGKSQCTEQRAGQRYLGPHALTDSRNSRV